MKVWEHFRTITAHKLKVMLLCFRVGLFKQGLLHDMSKYTPTEFLTGCRYYQGTRSPNAREREVVGYSAAWMHHKGRNKHHFEYWTDFSIQSGRMAGVKMPVTYFVEMVMDRIAASKTYKGSAYKDSDSLVYFQNSTETDLMHPETRAQLLYVLKMLAARGERYTFRYLRHLLKKGSY